MRLDCCDVEVYDPELHEQLVMYPTEAVMLFDQGLATVAVSLGMDQDEAANVQVKSPLVWIPFTPVLHSGLAWSLTALERVFPGPSLQPQEVPAYARHQPIGH